MPTNPDADTAHPAIPAGAVEVRMGHHGDSHLRIKGARLASPTKDGTVFTGELEPGWTRLHVLTYGRDGRARLFVFEPAPGAQLDRPFGTFHVRGAAREVEHDNNPRRARERFDALPKD